MERISHSVELNCTVEALFAYYVNLGNLVRMTPPEWHLRIIKADVPLHQGSRVLFSTRFRMVPFEVHWLLRVRSFQENHSFVEVAERSPFRRWVHRHHFEALGENRSRVSDIIEYDHPNGLFARMAGRHLIHSMLENTFHYRQIVLRKDLEGG